MCFTDALLMRQNAIAENKAEPLALPKFPTYCICNLRGGIGKTSLAFNLSYLVENLLAVDTCPQGNLSYFYNDTYYQSVQVSAYDMLLPYFMPGLGYASRVAQYVGATNLYFRDRSVYFIPSADALYNFPSQMAVAMGQAMSVAGQQQQDLLDRMLFSLRAEIRREMEETETDKCLIDTSPFFAGATHLAWHATDALVVPVRTDQQSINSFKLLLQTLSDPSSPFRRILPYDSHTPKIQLVVLTHCGWSTRAGARNEPNRQTRLYLEQIRDLVARNILHFTTRNPENHIVLLDDFLGSGRISSAQSKPIELLNPGESVTIQRVRVEVNESVNKIKNQLHFISNSIW